MATDLERLVVQLQADVRSFEKQMAKARGVSAREFSAIEKKAKQLNANLNNIGKGFGRGLAAPLSGIAAALSVREVVQYADAWTVAGNKIKAASAVAGRAGRDLSGITDIANETRSGLTETADLYAKLLRATKDVAQSEEEVARATVIVNKAFKAGGAAASEQAAGVLQLAQALGSGVLQGDELRSLRENAPLIAQAIADEFKTTIAGLKELGANGELETGRVFKAILKAQPQIEKAFSTTNQTIADSFAKIQNQFTRYIGQSDESLGASQRLIAGLNALADNFDETADAAIAFASILAAGLLGRSIGGMIAKLGLAGVAFTKFIGTLKAAQAAARGGLLLGGLSAAAGPLGAAIGVAAAAALYFATSADDAGESSETAAQKADRYAAALKRVKGAAEEAGEAAAKSGRKFVETETFRLSQQVKGDLDEYKKTAAEVREAAQRALDRLNDVRGEFGDDPEFQAQVKALETLRDSLDGTADGGVKAQEALNGLATSDPGFENLANKLNPLLDKLIGIGDEVRRTAEELKTLGAVETPSFRQSENESMDSWRRLQEERQKFFDERTTDASRTEFEREIDTRTDQILKAAEDAGIALSEAAARIQAKTELAAEKSVQTTSRALEDVRKSLIDTARGFQGFNENQPTQRNALSDFFKAANQNVDPKITAWCAAFVNAVLATNGLPGTGRLNARSFLDYGTPTENPQPGDLVILKRGSGNVQGHVGFFMGNAEGGGVRVLGGNQGDAVNEKTFRSEDVLGFRQVPGGASEGLAKEVELRREQLTLIREMLEAGQEETARIQLETSLVGASNAEREKETFIFERLNELKRAGITLTPEILAGIEAEANARYGAVASYDAATEAAERLRQKQEELAAVNDDIGYAFQSSIKGLISDLAQGKSATEALYNAVSRLADRLLDIALDQLFKGVFTGGANGGGLLGGLFSGLFGFDQGGYTGNIAKNKPAGVVHGREFVVNAEATKKNRSLLEAINAGMSGYAEGGYVIPRVGGKAAAPVPAAASGPVDVHVQNINTFDAQAFLSQALSSQAGVKTILNVVRAQPGAFKAALNG